MKKHYYLYIVAILALVVVLPAAVRAEEETTNVTIEASASADVEIRPGTVSPPPRPGTPVPTMIREQLRGKNENIQNNVEIRNKILENRKLASTTRPLGQGVRAMASSTRAERADIRGERREEVGDIRREGRDDMKNASTTGERREIRRDMRMDIFKVRKEALIKQLNVSLNNLKQIRERISSRIDKATAEGRNMTEAKSLLVTADAKITAAITAVDTLASLTPPTIYPNCLRVKGPMILSSISMNCGTRNFIVIV